MRALEKYHIKYATIQPDSPLGITFSTFNFQLSIFNFKERSTWNTPYKFSGKELDDETGYSYFGARYYDPNISIWLSVDPLADKYPTLSAYVYTANNPIMLVDPNGRDIYVTGEGSTNVIEKIQSKTKLNVVYDQHTGRVTFEGRARKKQDKMLVQMANDKNVDVNIEAVMNTEVIPGSNGQEKFSGGAHLGTSFDGNCASSKQIINADVLQGLTAHFEGEFDFLMHEVFVAYGAGKAAYSKGIVSGFSRDINNYEAGKGFASKSGFPQAPPDIMHRNLRDRNDEFIYIQQYNRPGFTPIAPGKVNARTGKREKW